MKNNGDNLILGCEEWPSVGDTVFIEATTESPILPDMFRFDGEDALVISKAHRHGGDILTLEHPEHGVMAILNGSWVKRPQPTKAEGGEPEEKTLWSAGDEIDFPSGRGVLVLSEPDDNGIVIVKSDDPDFGSVYKRVSILSLSKPKTPKGKLLDDVLKLIDSYTLNAKSLTDELFEKCIKKEQDIIKEALIDYIDGSASHVVADKILENFNVTKK